MSAKIKHRCLSLTAVILGLFSQGSAAVPANSLAAQLGWVPDASHFCGGYYLDQAFNYPLSPDNSQKDTLEIASDETLFSQHSTSVLQGKVSLTRLGQQMTANKAYLYRDPTTGKLSTLDLI